MNNVIRFPTEKCRLPGESLAAFNLRKLNQVDVPNIFAWDPPLLDELAQGVQDSHPYP